MHAQTDIQVNNIMLPAANRMGGEGHKNAESIEAVQ